MRLLSALWVISAGISLSIQSLAALKPTTFNQLPNWPDGQQQLAIPALKASCKVNSSTVWRRACHAASKLPEHLTSTQARAFLSRYFQPYQVNDNGHTHGLFTGYYEPTIPGSRQKTARYTVPIYGKPLNLVRTKNGMRLKVKGNYIQPPTRAEISAGPLLAKTPVLAWIHSKIDRFFLQIQGSGSITLKNGQRLLLGYAAQSGHPYYPIGAYLVKKGYLSRKNVSMQSIHQWLIAHPQQAQQVMNLNPSFVFFRQIHADNPIGAQGVPLTPGRSLAVDRKKIRLGTPVWLSTYLPQPTADRITHGEKLERLMIAQDTGGAIRGLIRGDVFWGSGKRAKYLAGHMQSQGQIWLLRPKH